MAINHEKVTTQTVIPILVPISRTASAVGGILDVSGYDDGVYFMCVAPVWTSGAGTYTLKIEQSSSATFAGSVETTLTVAAGNIINALPVLSAANVVTAIGAVTGVAKCGITSTQRYIRCSLILAGTATAVVGIYAIINPDSTSMPTAASI